LCEEFFRNDFEFEVKTRKLIDTQIIFHKMEERTLKAAYKFYCDKDLENAHSAEADTLATFEVLKAQIEKYPELPNDMDGIYEFIKVPPMIDPDRKIILDENGVEIFNFGKHKGKTLEEIYKREPAYFNWMLERDFLNTTKRFIQDFQMRMLQNKFKS
jgi:DNA polymerase-3 subunit epsilon